uniref:Transcriptional repressor rco-1 n=1 Tax=Ganoderma boninense TaxID=34458 RepID=A0A5K1K3K9_9APHY|nr:Transcriptional repressor rco-1 [Ganoderma boninense]
MHLCKLLSLVALPLLVVASPRPDPTQTSEISHISSSSTSPHSSSASTKSSQGSSPSSANGTTAITRASTTRTSASATTTTSTAAASPSPPPPFKNSTTGLVNGVLSVGSYTPKLSKYLPVADISWDKYSVIKFGPL